MKLIYIDDKPHRKLTARAYLRNGDRFINNAQVNAPFQTVTGRNPEGPYVDVVGQWKQFDFYREIDPLIHAMIQAKRKARKCK